MVRLKYLVGAGVILAAGLLAFYLFYDSPEAQVKKRLRALSAALSLESGEGRLQAAAKAKKIADMLAERTQITIYAYDIERTVTREKAQSYIMAGRSRYQGLSVKFHDVSVRFARPEAAVVSATVYVKTRRSGNTPAEDVFEMRCRLQRQEDVWRFTEFSEVEVLAK